MKTLLFHKVSSLQDLPPAIGTARRRTCHAIGTENVLILTSEFVDHVYNVAETSMMQSQPTVLPPGISLSKSGTFLDAMHTPCRTQPN